MTQTPASGPRGPVTTPPMSSLSTATCATVCAHIPVSEVTTIVRTAIARNCITNFLVMWTPFLHGISFVGLEMTGTVNRYSARLSNSHVTDALTIFIRSRDIELL